VIGGEDPLGEECLRRKAYINTLYAEAKARLAWEFAKTTTPIMSNHVHQHRHPYQERSSSEQACHRRCKYHHPGDLPAVEGHQVPERVPDRERPVREVLLRRSPVVIKRRGDLQVPSFLPRFSEKTSSRMRSQLS
jgi:hypothetical protein